MKNILIILIIVCIHISIWSNNERGLSTVKQVQSEQNNEYTIKNLNTLKTFEKIKKNDTVALLIGNDDYLPSSDFEPLQQCINDTRLISQILKICCKVPEQNIIKGYDLTKKDFITLFKNSTAKLKPEQSFLFMYSGHGYKDGSLVFVDGELLHPEELKKLINGFLNDTTLIIDACYAGNNEGPTDQQNDNGYKKNCLRIYGSLAHMSAKEILYNKKYFSHIKPFYRNVLDLVNISGNGYFSSFIGYFFAEYNFDESENISFKDVIDYIQNKNKQYVEFLALRGQETNEAEIRLNQQPKIYPYEKSVAYDDINHKFLVIKKYRKKSGLYPEVSGGPLMNFGILTTSSDNILFRNTISAIANVRLTYQPDFFRGFMFGFETGYIFSYRRNDPVYNQDIILNIIPVLTFVGYHHQFRKLKNHLSLTTDIGGGFAVSIWNFMSYKSLPADLYSTINFNFQSQIGIGIHPVKNFKIGIGVGVYGILYDWENILVSLKIPISIHYKF